MSDVGTAKIITPPIFLHTSAGVFTTGDAPVVTGPSGSTWTVTGQGSATLTLTAGGTALPTTNNTYTVSGLTVDVPAGVGTVHAHRSIRWSGAWYHCASVQH